jgi:hypothetical protein
MIILPTLLSVSLSMTPLESAIWQVETNQCELDCPKGDGGNAIGPLQIHRCCWEDVKRDGEQYSDCEGLDYSFEIFDRYMSRYATPERLERSVTNEDKARIWNGGPNGWRKDSTNNYWNKVRKELESNQI